MVGINSNIAAASATRNLGTANSVVSSSIAKLSSGNRIIKASDDVAGLAIGTSLASVVKTLQISLLNTQQATSVLSIADGALQQIGDILSRQKSLATQANSGSLGLTERGYLNQEFQALTSEIDRIVTATQFNGITLLNGSLGASTEGLSTLAATVSFDTTAANLYSGTVGTSAVNSSTLGLTISNDDGNAAIIGSTAGIQVSAETFSANNTVVFQISLAGQTYRSAAASLATANTNVALTFTNTADSGATIAFNLLTYGIPASTANLNTIASNIQADLDGLTIYQSRTFATTTGNITSTTLNGTILEGLDGADFQLVGTSFNTTDNTAPVISSFSAVAETTTTDGKITATINGESYSTVDGEFDSAGNDLQGQNLGGGTGIIRLYKAGDAVANPNEYLDIDITSGSGASYTSIDFDSAGSANAISAALNQAFGTGSNGALSFQVGANVTDAIAVSIDSVKTTDIFLDGNGDYQAVDITTQQGAQDAIEVLDNAVASVISRRADTGAAISRFNFAASNLEVSIANQDNARGTFLDADTATESTNFATAQVKLQASIAVLAQANALPRTLLQLLQ